VLLALLRIGLLIAHLLGGLAVAAAIFPWLAQPRRNSIIRVWSRWLLAISGARLRVTGLPLPPAIARTGIASGSAGRMLLVNHVSWIDPFALNAALPSRFVAKSEIRAWPLLGMLVTLVGALYIERGRRHAVASMNHRVRDRLRAGETVAVFAEGTTTDGRSLLPFHSNLLAPALEVDAECWPVALRYTEDGEPSTAAAFVGEMSIVESIWNILMARRLQIEVAFLEPVPTGGRRNRHHVAEVAAERVAAWLDVPAPVGRRFNGKPGAVADPVDSAGVPAGATAASGS